MKTRRRPLVVFDIGNVLLSFSIERARQNFNRLDPRSGDILCRAMWETPLGEQLESGQMDGPGFFRRATRGAQLSLGYRRFLIAFRDIFTPIHENLSLLRQLSRRHPTALLSNVSGIHWAHLMTTYPALKSARWRFSSFRMKCLKPDVRIYHRVSEKTGFHFPDMIYFDDREDFVSSAKKLGIRAHVYNGKVPLRQILLKEGIR